MKKIEHIGIVVGDIEKASKNYEKLFKKKPYKSEYVESEKVQTVFFEIANSKIELLSSKEKEHTINKFISKKGEGIHHIAFEVENIYESIKEYTSKGFQLVNKDPKKGADNKLVCFIHPKSTNGILIELCQSI